jgi:hypothetical protein
MTGEGHAVTTLTDTSPEAQRVLDECLRRMPPERKWRIMLDLNRTARALHEAGFRMRHPAATRRTIQADWRKMALGPLWHPRFAEIPEMDVASLDNVPVIREVATILRRLGVAFALGGSWASSLQGQARTTYDADITAEPFPGREAEFAAAFGPDYYVSEIAIREAIQRQSSFNVIHLPSSFKVDVFIRKDTPFGRSVLARRLPTMIPSDPPESIDVVSPEDIILLKLEWYRLGGETSDRQWGDVLGVFRIQAGRLDDVYLDRWAAELNVADLIAKARAAAAPPPAADPA